MLVAVEVAPPPVVPVVAQVGGVSGQMRDGDIVWQRLCQLMQWREQGHFSDAEFESAKRSLGLH